MAKKDFGVDIDLHGNQLLRARYENLPSAPSSPQQGQAYFNTTNNFFFGWNGTDWIKLSFGDSQSYTHLQSVPASTWNVTHNLGFFPNVTVVDSSGNKVEGDVNYIDQNSLSISFSSAFAGDAYMS